MKARHSSVGIYMSHMMYCRACAVLLVILLIVQLFHFEELPDALIEMGLPNSLFFSRVVAMTLIAVELVALPYLIGMKLHSTIIRVSRMAGLVCGGLWVALAAWSIGASEDTMPTALFGTTLAIPGGLWVLCFSLLFAACLCLAVYRPEDIMQRLGLRKRS